MEIAGRAHEPAEILFVNIKRAALLMEIIEQLEIFALRDSRDRVFLRKALPLVQPFATLLRIARPADPDRIVGNIRAAATPGQDVLGRERATLYSAVDARVRVFVLVKPFADRGRPHDLSFTEFGEPAHLEGPGIRESR